MKPLITLQSVAAKAPNAYGYDRIHILAFNFDGQGTALVRFDNERHYQSLGPEDVSIILTGDPYHGTRWYAPVSTRKLRSRLRS